MKSIDFGAHSSQGALFMIPFLVAASSCGHAREPLVSPIRANFYRVEREKLDNVMKYGDAVILTDHFPGIGSLAAAPTPATQAANPFPAPPTRAFRVSESVSPCEDFNLYACSEEIKASPLGQGAGELRYGFDDAKARVGALRYSYLKSSDVASDSARERMVATAFQACRNEPARLSEEQEHFTRTVAALSALDKTGLIRRLVSGARNGEFSLTPLRVGSANLDDPLKRDIAITSPTLFLSLKDAYAEQRVRDAYVALLVDFFEMAGRDSPAEDAEKVFAFEKAIADASPNSTELYAAYAERNYVERNELLTKASHLNLASLFEGVPASVQVRLHHPKTLDVVDTLVGSTDEETIRSYILFRDLIDTIKFSAPELAHAKRSLVQGIVGGSAKEESHEKECTLSVVKSLGFSIDDAVVAREFKDFPRDRVLSVLVSVKSQVKKAIERNTWLSAPALAKSMLKMESLSFQVMVPDDPSDLPLEPVLDLDRSRHLANVAAINRAKTAARYQSLTLPRNGNEWSMPMLEVNAYYNLNANKFVMPLGILQAPFFSPDATDAENFGGMGAVVGHEIGHAIDDQGSKYDETGRLAPWMNEADVAEFKKRSGLLVRQFDDAGANGTLTLGENIADLVGTAESFNALTGQQKLDQAAKRGFYLQWARVWCANTTPEARLARIKRGPHSPADLRVNMPLRQQPAFAEAFGCKAGDKMTLPESERVSIW